MENKELKEFKEILHEVKDLDRFGKFMLFCMERLARGEDLKRVVRRKDVRCNPDSDFPTGTFD